MRQRLLEAENTILDLKRDRRRLIDRTVKTQGHNIDLQFELSQQDELRERDRAHDRQVTRKAVGLLDRTLVELHALNQFQTFYAPSGRCWHFSRDCGALANTAQVTVRNPCSFCLNGDLFFLHPFFSPCRLHSMQRIEASHVERELFHLVIDLGRCHFHCAFSIQEWVGIL